MPHEIAREVSHADIDELAHASNIVYVRWVIEAAVSHSTALGITPAHYRQRGQSFVVRRHTVDYLRPAALADPLVVETRVILLRGTTSERETVIKHSESGVVLAHALTLWAFMDLTTGRPVRIPADIRSVFTIEPSAHEQSTPTKPVEPR